jgi:hypothetical protein
MAIKVPDRIAGWYLKNVVIAGEEKINTPGYLYSEVNTKGIKSYIREIAFPEKVFIELEKNLILEYPKDAPAILYAAGKKFSFAYSSMSNYPIYGISPQKDWDQLADYSTLFIEAFYASKITKSIDLTKKELDLYLEDYVICSKNGHGYLLTAGVAGLWAYVINDTSVEGVQLECQGSGAKSCHLICAPRKVLDERGIKYYNVDDVEKINVTKEYLSINGVKPNRYSTLSLQGLIDSKLASYSHGQITFDNERYFVDDATLPYFLERELLRLPKGNEILFKTAFAYAKEKMLNYNKVKVTIQFVVDLLSAFGWGDTFIKKHDGKYEITISHFPWLKDIEHTESSLFSGMLSGFISGIEKRDIILKRKTTSTISGDYVLSFSE